MKLTKRSVLRLAIAASLPFKSIDAFSQTNITILSPGNPGGILDITIRKIFTQIQINALVKSHPGGNGAVVLNKYHASAENNTYIALTSGAVAGSSALRELNLKINPLEDLEPIALLTIAPFYIFAKKDTGTDIQHFLKSDRELLHGSLGNNSADTMAAYSFLNEYGINFRQINYKSPQDALRDLNGGQLDLATTSLVTAAPFIKGQMIRPLVSLTKHAEDSYANLSAAQFLKKPFSMGGWIGLFKTKANTSPLDTTLKARIKSAINDEEFRSSMMALGAALQYEDGEIFKTRIQQDFLRYEQFFNQVSK